MFLLQLANRNVSSKAFSSFANYAPFLANRAGFRAEEPMLRICFDFDN
jgi:hypothetical protein